jgi:hypothetical protein
MHPQPAEKVVVKIKVVKITSTTIVPQDLSKDHCSDVSNLIAGQIKMLQGAWCLEAPSQGQETMVINLVIHQTELGQRRYPSHQVSDHGQVVGF